MMTKESLESHSAPDYETKEKAGEYDPIYVLRNREILPESIFIGEDGKETMDDEDLSYVHKFLRKNIKNGSVLNLGGGLTHAHRMLPIADKITHATSLDISENNNQVTAELLESIRGGGAPALVEEEDVRLFKILAGATANDKKYHIKNGGNELLSMLYEKSQYKGKLDIIAADMIAQMEELGSGELVDRRTYDNVLLLFSLFTRDRKETLALIKNAKKRLNDGGRLIVMDVWDFDGVGENASEDDCMHSEDEQVRSLYPKPWIWDTEEFIEILQEAGFSKIKSEEHEVEESEEEKNAIGGYVSLVAR